MKIFTLDVAFTFMLIVNQVTTQGMLDLFSSGSTFMDPTTSGGMFMDAATREEQMAEAMSETYYPAMQRARDTTLQLQLFDSMNRYRAEPTPALTIPTHVNNALNAAAPGITWASLTGGNNQIKQNENRNPRKQNNGAAMFDQWAQARIGDIFGRRNNHRRTNRNDQLPLDLWGQKSLDANTPPKVQYKWGKNTQKQQTQRIQSARLQKMLGQGVHHQNRWDQGLQAKNLWGKGSRNQNLVGQISQNQNRWGHGSQVKSLWGQSSQNSQDHWRRQKTTPELTIRTLGHSQHQWTPSSHDQNVQHKLRLNLLPHLQQSPIGHDAQKFGARIITSPDHLRQSAKANIDPWLLGSKGQDPKPPTHTQNKLHPTAHPGAAAHDPFPQSRQNMMQNLFEVLVSYKNNPGRSHSFRRIM